MTNVRGRLVNIDRLNMWKPTGKVIFFDDFEEGAVTDRYVSSGTTAFDSSVNIEGSQSCKLTTGGTGGDAASITLFLGKVVTSNIWAVSVKWCGGYAYTNIRGMEVTINYYTGAVKRTYGIKWIGETATVDTKAWYYWNGSGAYAAITGGSQSIYTHASNWCFHHLKFSVDLSSDLWYKKLYADDLDINLEALSYVGQTAADTSTAPHLEFMIQATTEGDAALPVYLDDLIITSHEG